MGARIEHVTRAINLSTELASSTVTNVGSIVVPKGYRITLKNLHGYFHVNEDIQDAWVWLQLWKQITPSGTQNPGEVTDIVYNTGWAQQETGAVVNSHQIMAHNFDHTFNYESHREALSRGYQKSQIWVPQGSQDGWSFVLYGVFETTNPATVWGRCVINYELEYIGSTSHDELRDNHYGLLEADT